LYRRINTATIYDTAHHYMQCVDSSGGLVLYW